MKHNEPKHVARESRRKSSLPKAPTGIQGLDELTGGGLPKGRPTLLCGNAGCGKTLLAMEFLVRGATDLGEPGVFMAFEETTGDLATNFASLGYDLKALVAQKKLALKFVHIERSEIEEAGEYDLEGLFIRLGQAIDSIGAKRVEGQMATRRLRIVKYRGSTHGTSEYPFLINEGGISILPVTSMGLTHEASTERVSTGILRLDAMMGGKGYYRGSSVLVSGAAGSGKTSLAACFAHSASVRGEPCLWFAFEESPSQIIRNMRSIGIDLEPAVRRGVLRVHAVRPSICGLEMHLVTIHKLVNQFKPRGVIIDPISSFAALGSVAEVTAMLTRLIDFFKMQKITALLTSLTGGSVVSESAELGVSSLMDTWLLLQDVENGAECNRVLHLVKSRGMSHSNQVREFLLTDHGVELRDVYVGPSGLLVVGGAREALEAQEKAQVLVHGQETESKKRGLERKRQAIEAQIALLRTEFEVEQAEATKTIGQDHTRAGVLIGDRVQMARQRQGDVVATRKTSKHK